MISSATDYHLALLRTQRRRGGFSPASVAGLVADWNPDAAGALTLVDPAPLFVSPTNFTAVQWVKNACSVVMGATDPFGGVLAGTFTESGTVDSHYFSQTPSPAPTTNGLCEYSCYFKAGTRIWAYIAPNNAATFAFFRLDTGVLGTKHANIVDYQMTSMGNGWYHCRVWTKYTAASGCRFGMSNADATFSYAGSGTDTILAYLPSVQAKLITQLNDAKGGFHATQSVDANKPLWVPDYWAPGRGGILGDGASSFLIADAVCPSFHGIATPICRYYVQHLPSTGAAVNDFIAPAFGKSTGATQARHDFFVSGNMQTSRSNDSGTADSDNTGSAMDFVKRYWSDRFTGSRRKVWRSGVQLMDAAQSTTGTFTPGYFTMLAWRHSAGPTVQGWVGGFHGRHFVYNVDISDPDHLLLEAYLKGQYSL